MHLFPFYAGGDEPLGTQIPSMFFNFIGSDIDWKYNTEPEKKACLSSPEQRCFWPRGKVLGGTSVLNGMQVKKKKITFIMIDYDKTKINCSIL